MMHKNLTGKKVSICVDSQAALKAPKRAYFNSELTLLECQDYLSKLDEGIVVELY